MSDPVQEFKRKYRSGGAISVPGDQQVPDPVAEFHKRYGMPPTAPVPVDQMPPEDDTGVMHSLATAGVAAVKRLPGLAKDLIAANLEPFIGGVTQEQKDNPLSRSASRRFGPSTLDQTLTNEQRGVPDGQGPVEFAKSIVTAPYTTTKALLQSQSAKEVGERFPDFAFAILAAHGLISEARGAMAGKKPPAAPGEPPTAPSPDAPLPEPPLADEIIGKAEAQRAAAKSARSESASAAAKRRIAWAKMTPGQRAWVTPELPVPESEKAWADLSPESKEVIKRSWQPKPVSDTNLDTSGEPPTAGGAGGADVPVGSGEGGVVDGGDVAGQDASVVGEIGAGGESGLPVGHPLKGKPVVGTIVSAPETLTRSVTTPDGGAGVIEEQNVPKGTKGTVVRYKQSHAGEEWYEVKFDGVQGTHLMSRGEIGERAEGHTSYNIESEDAAHIQQASELAVPDKNKNQPQLTQALADGQITTEQYQRMTDANMRSDTPFNELTPDQLQHRGELIEWLNKQGGTQPGGTGPIPIPPVEDLSRGTYGGPDRRDAGRVLSAEDLLKVARDRRVLGDQTPSGGSLGQDLPPRTPEAQAAMATNELPPEPAWGSDIPTGQPGLSIEDVDGGKFVVSRDASGNPNGYLTIEDMGNGNHRVVNLEVRPDVRRQGIATKMYELARKSGVKRFINSVENRSPKGAALVESLKSRGIYGDESPVPAPKAKSKFGKKTVEELKADLAQLHKDYERNATGGREPLLERIGRLTKTIAKREQEEAKGSAPTPATTPTPAPLAPDLATPQVSAPSPLEPVPEPAQPAPDAAKVKKPRAKKEVTPERALDRAESVNDRALDKGEITQAQWETEQNRIVEERLRIRAEAKAASDQLPKTEAVPVEATLQPPDYSNQRVTTKAKPVEPGLDPKGFAGRMRDNLKKVPDAELEQRLTELVGRKSQVVGDREATKMYQDRINQIHEEQEARNAPSEQRYAGGPSPVEAIKNLFKHRKVTNDLAPEQMSAAERKIAESVHTEPDLTQPLGLQESLRQAWNRVVDSQAGFKRAASKIFGKGSSEARRLDMLSEVASGALTRAEEVIRGQGPMLPTPNGQNWVRTGTRSIHDVIQSVGGQAMVGRLGRVWASLNTIELHGKGKIAGPDVIAANKFIREVDPKFIAGAMELRKIGFDLAQYAHWGGLITNDALESFAKQAFYAPIKRLLAHEGTGDTLGTTGGRDVVSASGQPIKRLKGSRKPQLNPVETLIDNTYRTIRAAEQNYRVSELVKGAKDNPTQAKGILEPASHQDYKAMQKTLEGKAEAAVGEAAKQGIPLTKEEALTQLKMVGDETLNITDNLLHVWIDGKPALWRMSNELSYAVKHMQAEEFKMLTKVAGLPAALVHAGVVADPFFVARQLVLDSMQGYINSRYGFNPLAGDQIRGWLQLIRNTPVAQEYRLAGGGFSGLTSSRFRSASTSLADAVRPRTSGLLGEAVAQIKEFRPVQAWKTLVAPFEEAARVGEYMRARGAGASMLEAVYAAKRITTNFQRSGGEMMAAAHTVPFLNAAIQGVAQAAENFSRAPKQWTMRAGIAAAVPAFTLWWMNKDDKEIQELRRTESGARYFFFRSPEGTILKMRKPYLEGAIFANGIEAGLDAINEKNPAVMAEWGKAIAREAGFNAITTIGYVPLSLWANKDLRTGLPIVPEKMADVDPAYQAGPYTGSASRVIGEAAGVSPAQVEFGIKNTLGGAGSLALKAVDAALDYRKTGSIVKAADVPGLNSFVAKYPTQSVAPMQDFYRESERLAKVSNTIKYLGETRPDALNGYLESHKDDLVMLQLYGNSREKIGAAQRSINLIRDMPAESITQTEKDNLINSLIFNMIQQAKTTNEIAKQLR